MNDKLVLILVLCILGAAAIAAAVYYTIRFLRGSIKLALPSTRFVSGDAITGSFILTAKKPLQGNRLTVVLIGEEVTKYRQGNSTRTRTHEIHRDEQVLEGAKEYPAGHSAVHEFSFIAPEKTVPGFGDSPISQTLSTAAELFTGRRTTLKWRIEARLDAKGVDLASSKSVRIS